jgi:hypothetical protein
MDIFFRDPSEIPLPPDGVRIRDLRADLSTDGHRLKVYLEVDPFQKRPSAQLRVINPTGDEISNVEIIETMNRKMELNLHLLSELIPGRYILEAVIYYADLPASEDAHDVKIDREIVDTAQMDFVIN